VHAETAVSAGATAPAEVTAPVEEQSVSWTSGGSGSVYTPTTLYSPLGTSGPGSDPVAEGAGGDAGTGEQAREQQVTEERGSEGTAEDSR
jgi:hypothetical protein